MAEGSDRVRTIRDHLRRGAALLKEGDVAAALAEADAALALDAQSPSAQTLRDRITAATRSSTRGLDTSLPQEPPKTFVPHGVNAASWRGFEQRIQERRFRALLDAINTSIVAGDPIAARVALEEARELRPGDPELRDVEARLTAMPQGPPPDAVPASRIWMRALGAVALFLVGVSLLMGVEWLRPSGPMSPLPVAVPSAPLAPSQDQPIVAAPEPIPVPVAVSDEEAVPAIITPPEPTLRPRGTTGTEPMATRPVALRETPHTSTAPATASRDASRRVVEAPPVRQMGEIPDDYVARAAVDRAAAPPPVPAVGTPPTSEPASLDARSAAMSLPLLASESSAATLGAADQRRVEEALRRYARAYGDLDASAARAVWPTVDEKALARAFQNLASQDVSFDDCDIQIRGAVANALCRGQASYQVKVGSREARTEPRLWRFELRRDGEAWKIEAAEARRQPTASYR